MNQFLQVSTDSGGSYINGMPMHCCSTNAITIRDEIDFLKNDFNVRFKQIIFTSILNAYFGGCVPCFFAQKVVNYDVLISMVNIVFFWVGGFALSTAFSLPAKYFDILHRASLHLGKWIPVEDPGIAKVHLWTKAASWEEGTIVKHNEKFYRSVGPVTTAVPGNASHQRFFVSRRNVSCFRILYFEFSENLQQSIVHVHGIVYNSGGVGLGPNRFALLLQLRMAQYHLFGVPLHDKQLLLVQNSPRLFGNAQDLFNGNVPLRKEVQHPFSIKKTLDNLA